MSHRSESRHLPVRAYGDLAEEGDAEAYEAEEEVICGDPHIKNPHPGIECTYLVPGGRFLVTVDETWLLVWDLGPPGKKDEPAVWMQHRLDCTGSIKFLDVHIVENTALRIVLQEKFYNEVPSYIDPSQLPDDPKTRLTAFHRFEICLPENGDYAIKMQGRLCVARTDNDDIKAAQCGHTVALGVSSDVVLLWDTRGWTFSLWKLPEDSTFYMQQGYLFAITGKGVQVIDFKTHSPRDLVTNQPVDLRSLSPATAPVYHSYEWPIEMGTISRVVLPKSIPASGRVEYELRVNVKNCTHKMHRFSHDFKPESPSSSIPRLLDSSADLSELPWVRFECGNGDWGCIWEDDPDVSNITMTLQGKSGLLAHSEYSDPVSIMTPENQSTIIQEVNVCPFSGRVVFLWDRRILEDAMLEIVDYL